MSTRFLTCARAACGASDVMIGINSRSILRYPDVAPLSDSHLRCCDLPKRGVVHYGKQEATSYRGVTTGMLIASVVAELPKVEALVRLTPAGASAALNWREL
jgi:hypothetical protein